MIGGRDGVTPPLDPFESVIPPACAVTRLWMDYASAFKYPASFALWSLMGAVSAAINGRILINPDAEPTTFTNQYIILYGPSGCGKNTAIRHVEHLLEAAVPECPVLPEGFTMESLRSYLSEESKEKGYAKGVIFTPELTTLIGQREYQLGSTTFLSDLWDCRPEMPYYTQTNKGELIEKPYIVHLAATSPEWLLTSDPRMLTGGYVRRVMLVVATAGRRLSAVAHRDQVKFGAVVRVMRQRLAPGAFGGTAMRLTPAAIGWMDAWTDRRVQPMIDSSDKIEQELGSTLQVHVMKTAACLSVLEGAGAVRLEAPFLEIAAAAVEALLPGMKRAYAGLVPTPNARLKATIMDRLTGGALIEWQILSAVSGAMGAKHHDIREAIQELMSERKVTRGNDGKFEILTT